MKSSYTDSLVHIIWECKYHIVFAINSTGTFGLIPVNERKVIQEYCNKLISYDRMMNGRS